MININPPARPPGDELITKDELARRLKKAPRTIEKWQRLGMIPAIKVGTSVLYDWPDVRAHLSAHFRICPALHDQTSRRPEHSK